MKVSSQRLPDSQVLLEIEVDPEQMERSLERAYRTLAQRTEVPGFRKGKAPRNMIERHLGHSRLVREAVDSLIPEAYNRAIEEQDVDAIDQPSIELVSAEPLSFKATVPVRPTVDLGDYHSLRVEREPVTADEKQVDEMVEDLRRRYAVQEPVERPVQTGDIVRADVRLVIDGQERYKEDDAEFRLREGANILLPGVAEEIVGLGKGDTKDIAARVPEGDGPLAGKEATVTVTVRDVKSEQLPELNDDFAREVGEGFPSLEALRERLRSDLKERREAEAEEEFRDKAVGALVEAAEKIEFPPVLIEREFDRLLHDRAHAVGQEPEQYLATIKRTREEVREDLLPVATERVRRSLALTQLAEQEKIEPQDADIDAEVERLVGSGERQEQLRRLFGSADGRAAITRSLLTRKTLDRLVEIVSQDGAGLRAQEPQKEAVGAGSRSARARGKKSKEEEK